MVDGPTERLESGQTPDDELPIVCSGVFGCAPLPKGLASTAAHTLDVDHAAIGAGYLDLDADNTIMITVSNDPVIPVRSCVAALTLCRIIFLIPSSAASLFLSRDALCLAKSLASSSDQATSLTRC